MPNEKKTTGQEHCQEPHQSEADGRGRKRAPDQDLLPGILGKQLRAAYGELLNSPIPDAFAELIKRLEGQEPAQPPPGSPGKPRREESDK